jgi:hypothetical protein
MAMLCALRLSIGSSRPGMKSLVLYFRARDESVWFDRSRLPLFVFFFYVIAKNKENRKNNKIKAILLRQ